MLPSEGAQMLSRLPFVAAYLFCLYSVWRNPLSPVRTVMGCLMGYLCYFMLATGVHENHLFVGVLLALYLFATSHVSLEITASLALIMNANLMAFNSLEGYALRCERALGQELDVAVLMAIANVMVSALIVWTLARQMRPNGQIQSPGRDDRQ